MEFISLFVMAAIIYGFVGIFTARNGPVRTPQRRPAPMPRPKPDETRTERKPWVMEEVSKTRMSPDRSKQEELVRSQGKEGAWGDEGREIQDQGSLEGVSDYISTSGIGTKQRASSREEDDELIFDERNLAQGIIWAEVLGKPRSLRPFRSRL